MNKHIDFIMLDPPVETYVDPEGQRLSHIVQFTPKYNNYIVISQAGKVIGRGTVKMYSLGVR